VEIDLTTADQKFVRGRARGIELGDSGGGGHVHEKHDVERLGVGAGSQEWVATGDLAKLIGRARHHRNAVAEALRDGLCDESGDATGEGRRRLEHHVAALDVGLHAVATGVAK
jgi:hypothetical protein